MRQVSDDVVDKALEYLTDTDEEFGRMIGYIKLSKYWLNLVESEGYLLYKDGTQLQRKAEAVTSQEYRSFLHNLTEKSKEFHVMELKRESAQREVDIWRTISANQRK
jgi:hypothetical protein